jgi:transcription elongation GreA/GreB family factor
MSTKSAAVAEMADAKNEQTDAPLLDATGAGIKRIQRDLRYWIERQRTAELVKPTPPGATARFGSLVALERADGSSVEFRVVGEDEADPARGLISYVSPIAKLLIGASVGEEITLPEGAGEIVGIR